MKSKFFICVFSLLLSSLVGAVEGDVITNPVFDGDFKEAIDEYNASYEALVQDRTSWANALEELENELATLRDKFEGQAAGFKESVQRQDNIKLELEGQQGHLEFLQKIGPLSTKLIENFKIEVVAADEFQDVSLVSEDSLADKDKELQSEVDGFNDLIVGKRNEITAIEATQEYKDLVNDRNLWQGRKRVKLGELSTARQNLTNAESEKSDAEDRLAASEARESAASSNASELRDGSIPVAETERRRLLRQKEKLASERRTKADDLESAREKRREAAKQLEGLQEEVSDTESLIKDLKSTRRDLRGKRDSAKKPEKKAQFQARIDKINERIGRQQGILSRKSDRVSEVSGKLKRRRRRFRKAKNDLEAHDGLISDNTDAIDRNESEIRRLEDDAAEYERAASNERSLQITISSEVSQWSTRISALGGDISRFNRQLKTYQRNIDGALRAIGEFRTTHIVPLESEISGWNSEITALKSRQRFLTGQRSKILREKKNIEQSLSALLGQESRVSEWQVNLEESNQAVEVARQDQEVAKAALATHINKYNAFVEHVTRLENEFRQNEEKIINLVDAKTSEEGE